MSAATIVAGGDNCTARPMMIGCSTWFSMFWYTRKMTRHAMPVAAPCGRAEQHERHRAEQAADLRDQVRHRDPHRDQRRERNPERERGDERHDAGEHGDEHRARDVLADHLVHERAEAGRRPVFGDSGTSRRALVDELLTVEQQRDGEQQGEEPGRDTVGDRTGRPLDRLGVRAQPVGEFVEPALDLSRRVLIAAATSRSPGAARDRSRPSGCPS